MVGSPWRVSLDNPSCRTFNKEPASNGNISDYNNRGRTVSNANLAQVTAMFQNCSLHSAPDIQPESKSHFQEKD